MTDILRSAANDTSRSTEPGEATATFRVDVDGIVREWNDAMETLTGYPRGDVMGKPASGLQCPGCTIPTCPFAPQDLAAPANTAELSVETCLRCADGEIIPALKTTRPMHGPGDRVTGAVVILVKI